MCTNRALVESLEYYLDELVDSFEDFVKKSLVLISVGLISVIVMLAYMFNVFTNRLRIPNAVSDVNPTVQQDHRNESSTSIPSPTSVIKKGSIMKGDISDSPKDADTPANTVMPQPFQTDLSSDERVLKDIEFSNFNKNCDLKLQLDHKPPSRISVSSLPKCLVKRNLSTTTLQKPTSCYTGCCEDD